MQAVAVVDRSALAIQVQAVQAAVAQPTQPIRETEAMEQPIAVAVAVVLDLLERALVDRVVQEL
jgi:hypothetical protein